MSDTQLVEYLVDNRPPNYDYMGREEYAAGVGTMLDDLDRLARQDGCIAAAWALDAIRALGTPCHSCQQKREWARSAMESGLCPTVKLPRRIVDNGTI